MAASPRMPSTRHLVCPQCAGTYELGTDEYCPEDGERLQLIVEASVAEDDLGPVADQACDGEAAPTDAFVASAPESRSRTAESSPRERLHADEATHGDGGGAPTNEEDVSMVSRLFEQLGIKRKSKPEDLHQPKQEDAQNAARKKAASPAPDLDEEGDDNPLPVSVREAGWKLSGAPRTDEYADIWTVTQGSVQARFTRYRGRVLTSPALYRQLRQDQRCTALPAVLDAGTVNLRGHAHASFDLTALPASQGALQRLDDWLRLAPPSEQKAATLLPALATMLSELQAAGVAPILVQPSQILRHDSGRLLLSHVAALTSAGTGSAVAGYHPELECNPLISRLWGAPEILEQLVVHPEKAAVFSAGQILAMAVWGQPLDLATLRAGQIPLHSLQDARLARVLQGCLWAHHIEGRWSREALCQAVDAPMASMPAAEDWARLGPQAMGVAMALNGQTFWRVEDLLAAAVTPAHWPFATAQLVNILDWIEGSTWAGVVPLLREMLNRGRSADHVLIRLARHVRPDLPLTWRTLNFADHSARQTLTHLAQRSLADDATPADRELLRELFHADLRGAFVNK